jgi:hypothetical protein
MFITGIHVPVHQHYEDVCNYAKPNFHHVGNKFININACKYISIEKSVFGKYLVYANFSGSYYQLDCSFETEEMAKDFVKSLIEGGK